MNQGSVIVIVARLLTGLSGLGIRARARDSSVLEKPTEWVWDTPSPLLMGYWGALSTGVRMTSALVKNE